jgi:hypothetical protein
VEAEECDVALPKINLIAQQRMMKSAVTVKFAVFFP